jgi:hypothetical protein
MVETDYPEQLQIIDANDSERWPTEPLPAPVLTGCHTKERLSEGLGISPRRLRDILKSASSSGIAAIRYRSISLQFREQNVLIAPSLVCKTQKPASHNTNVQSTIGSNSGLNF